MTDTKVINDSARDTTVIRLTDISKRFIIRKEKSLKERLVNFGRSNLHKEDFWALRDVSLDIKMGTTVGLIGPNGSGKSTLLKVIGGILSPNSGTVLSRGRLAALLELGAGFHPDLTGRENVYLNAAVLGLTKAQTDAQFDEIVAFSGIEQFIDTQVKFYSSGMYVRLAFAVAVHVDPDILLVDEVLAVGDEPFQRKCMDKIRSFQEEGKTIILVTHSLEQIGELCDRAVVLRHGHVEFDGEPDGALRVLRSGFELSALEDQADADVLSNGSLAIESVHVVDAASSTPITIAKPGQRLRVDVTIRSDQELPNWVVGVGIDTPLGQAVFSTNTRILEGSRDRAKKVAPLKGTRTVSFDLPDVRLGHGQYVVNASVGSTEQESLVRVAEGASFESADGTRNRGVVSIEASYTVA